MVPDRASKQPLIDAMTIRCSGMPLKRRFACTLTVVALSLAGVAYTAEPDDRNPREYFFTPTFGDLAEEMQIARAEGKRGMLLFFEGEDCPYCVRMRRQVFSQRAVQDWYAKRFVSIAVDVYGDVELTDFARNTLPEKQFADRSGIFATPVVSFLDLNGVEIFRHSGMIATAQEFLLLGEYIAGEHYRNTDYDDFLRSRGTQNTSESLVTPTTPGDTL